MKYATRTALALCLFVASGAAQNGPVFELVSVRRAEPAAGPSSPRPGFSLLPGGRVEVRAQTVVELARVAFGFEQIDPSRGMVEAGPNWLWNDRFDITAAADHQWSTPPPGSMVPAELRPMLRTLLEDRFELKTRIETKNMSVTALRLVKPGELGPGLHRSLATCSPRCPLVRSRDRLEASDVTMAEATQLIAQFPELFVYRGPESQPILVDETALPGKYDLLLELPVNITSGVRGVGAEVRSIAIRSALEMQLGLKLEAARVPIPTLIIERGRKPRPD